MSKLLCNVLKISGGENAPNHPLVARLVVILAIWGPLSWEFATAGRTNFFHFDDVTMFTQTWYNLAPWLRPT